MKLSKSKHPFVTHVTLDPRLPPLTIADLALMLEIDLRLGRKKDFIKRLQKALNAVSSGHKVAIRLKM